MFPTSCQFHHFHCIFLVSVVIVAGMDIVKTAEVEGEQQRLVLDEKVHERGGMETTYQRLLAEGVTGAGVTEDEEAKAQTLPSSAVW